MSTFDISKFKIFLASVKKVMLTEQDFLELKKDSDYVKIYNDNKNFAEKDSRFLGAIQFHGVGSVFNFENYAHPIDKNIMVLPIEGETVLILQNSDEYYWLPYSVTQYPNYREDYKTTQATKRRTGTQNKNKNESYNRVNSTGIPDNKTNKSADEKINYIIKEKIKFIKPRKGDFIIQGRVGNTIRLSESFLVSEETSNRPSPSIIIRNKQNPELDDKKIGELVDEDINKDGSSIYIVSENCKIPYNHNTITKAKTAFKEYPSADKFIGDRIFVNSGQILLSAKAGEFIIFGKGNTGIITDKRFSVDAKEDIEFNTDSNVTIQSGPNRKMLFDSQGGTIYLGSDQGTGGAGAQVQKMVLGGDLFQVLNQLIDEIMKITHAGSCGNTTPPLNATSFVRIKSQLSNILSSRNYVSK